MTRGGWLLLACAAGCAHRGGLAAEDPAAHAQAMANEVEGLRGLGEKSPLRIEILGDAPFRAAVRKKIERARTAGGELRDRAFFVAFGFTTPEVDPAKLVSEVLDEQVVGFYDELEKRLYLRRLDPARPGAKAAGAIILAHEIEHALQDQHFGFPDPHQTLDDDARLARASVYEGDATLVMMAYGSLVAKQPLTDVLVRASRALANLGADALLRAVGQDAPKLREAPTLIREAFTFPYFEGMRLLTELYRTGGFSLVNRAFAHPPVSTEQVLHPVKYAAGEQPIPVRTPIAPAGTHAVSTGRLGELGTRALLEICLPYAGAKAAAEGWGGDAYAVVETSGGALALLWSTVWDSEAQAMRFERALRAQVACWPPEPTAAAQATRWWIPNGQRIERVGTRVSLVRGLDESARVAQAGVLLALVDAPLPAAPPLGELTLAPPTPLAGERPEERGQIVDGRYRSERLGVAAQLPAGFEASVAEPGFDLILKRAQPSRAFALFNFAPTRLSPEFEEQFFAAFPEQFAVGGVGPKEQDRGRGRVAFGEGSERSWSFPGRPLRVRASLMPVCNGRATMIFAQIWEDPAGSTVLDQWLSSFEAIGGTPPACRDLK